MNLKILSLGFIRHSDFFSLALGLSQCHSEGFFSLVLLVVCVGKETIFPPNKAQLLKGKSAKAAYVQRCWQSATNSVQSLRKKDFWRTDDQHPVPLV